MQKKWKKVKKSEKQKNRLEFGFALFRFKAKITKSKRIKKFTAKRSEKIEVKFYSEIVKHMWNGFKLYFAYKEKKILSDTGAP